MESTWDCYYGITKKLSLLAGQWPYQSKNERLLKISIITTSLLVVNIPQMCKFYECNKDSECIFRTLPPYILILVIMLKVYIGNFKTNRFKVLTDRVLVDWKELQNQEEYDIMKTYVANARWIVLMYFSMCITITNLFVLVSLVPHILDVLLPLNESRPIVLPFEAYYFVDERKYFYYIFFQAFVAAQIAITVLIAYDAMFMTFVEHVCGIFSVTGFRFEHLVCEDNDMVRIINNDLDDMYKKRMACCVSTHCAALEFAEHLENTFSINFGIELLLVTIVLSITLFQVTAQSDIIEILRHVTYVFAQLVHLFIFCWEGQRLIDHSLQMHDKIYSCIWYKIPPKSQRLILHVMRRSLRPKFLSASRVFVYSLQGFTAVVQTSMSYFTVLSSVD